MASPMDSTLITWRKKGVSATCNLYCCVPFCKSDSRNGEGLHFHHIPKNSDLKKRWIYNIRRDEGPLFKVTTCTVVCSKHFKKEDYTGLALVKKRLRKGAVPSVFDWSQENLLNSTWRNTRKVLAPRRRTLEDIDRGDDREMEKDVSEAAKNFEDDLPSGKSLDTFNCQNENNTGMSSEDCRPEKNMTISEKDNEDETYAGKPLEDCEGVKLTTKPTKDYENEKGLGYPLEDHHNEKSTVKPLIWCGNEKNTRKPTETYDLYLRRKYLLMETNR